nr:MAG TPA: hypothetical protein [Caudoviricetes sp.]
MPVLFCLSANILQSFFHFFPSCPISGKHLRLFLSANRILSGFCIDLPNSKLIPWLCGQEPVTAIGGKKSPPSGAGAVGISHIRSSQQTLPLKFFALLP